MLSKEEAKSKLKKAIESYRAGELVHAKLLCRQILDSDGNCQEAITILNEILIAQGSTKERLPLLLKAVTNNPESASCLFLLGNLYRCQGDLRLAADSYSKANKIRPSEPRILTYLGICQHGLNNFNGALQTLNKSILLDKNSESAWLFIGLSLAALREDCKAIDAYKNTIKINPSSNSAYSAFVNLGHLFEQRGDYKQAIYNYKKAIKTKTNCIEACVNLSLTYNSSNRLEEALHYACKAITLEPGNKKAHESLLSAARSTGEASKIIFNCHYSIKVNPCNSITYKILGNALYKKGALNLSTKAFELHYKYEPLIKAIRLSSNSSYHSTPAPFVAPDLELPRETLLIPSYSSDTQPTIKHLIYAHIPKTGGVSFANPIWNCINAWYIEKQAGKFRDLIDGLYSSDELRFISSYLIDTPPDSEAVNNSLRSTSKQKIDFTFIRPHKVSHKEIYSSFREHFGFSPFRLAVYREPISRLKSHFNHQWRLGKDLEAIRKSIDSRDLNLDNLIYRTCFSEFSSEICNGLSDRPEIDALIKLGDFSNLRKIQSALLSSFLLPNIITSSRLNRSKDFETLDSELIDDLVSECVQRGYIEHDLSQQVQSLVLDTIPENLTNGSVTNNEKIHPVTYLYKVTDKYFNFSGQMMSTEFLKTAEGADYMLRFFSDET